MKKTSVLILLLSCYCMLPAAVRSLEDARIIAAGKSKVNVSGSFRILPAEVATELVYTDNPTNDPAGNRDLFYVFNRGTGNGYAVISADDRITPILGYADSGSFNPENIPESLRYWLSQYSNEISALIAGSLKTSPTVQQVSAQTSLKTQVSPLLGKIQWGQGAPFNNLCPVINTSTGQKAVSGCVATGMAQVMKYYQWPVKGTGSYTYTSKTLGIVCSANFGNTTYDWNNMTDNYDNSSSTTQNEAVATLMYHCGVAVDMDYNESSGASTVKMGKALIGYFGYDADIQMFQREYYSRDEWINMLKTELNAGRPLLYNGNDGNNSGHLFVCDGYDSENYFHFNWGWDGYANGFFLISALNPGTGSMGTASGEGYNYNQSIVSGIQKPDNVSLPVYSMYIQGELYEENGTLARTGAFTISGEKIYNLGLNAFSGNLGIALYQQGNFLRYLGGYPVNLASRYGYSQIDFKNLTIPSTYVAGNYQLVPVYKTGTESVYKPVRGKQGTPWFLNLTLTPDQLIFSQPTETYPKISIDSCIIPGKIYQHKTARFSMKVSNKGRGEYSSDISLMLQSVSNDTVIRTITYNKILLLPGDSMYLQLTGVTDLPTGEYYLRTCYDAANNPMSPVTTFTGTSYKVTILPEPVSGIPELSLNKLMSFADNFKVENLKLNLTAEISNKGGFFEDGITGFIFPPGGGSSIAIFGYQQVVIDSLETVKITFTGEAGLEPGKYLAGLFYRKNNSWVRLLPLNYSVIEINIVNSIAAIKTLLTPALIVSPNPAVDFIQIELPEQMKSLQIYQLNGQSVDVAVETNEHYSRANVSSLASGYYILKFIAENGRIYTGDFIKK